MTLDAKAGVAFLSTLLWGCVIAAGPEDIFRPEKRTAAPPAGVRELFLETLDGTMINVWYSPPPESSSSLGRHAELPGGVTVFFLGGNAFYLADAESRLEAFANHGVGFFVMDYRGYGKSGGRPSVETIKSDSLTAYDYLVTSLDVPPEGLIVHGHSMGTVAAVHVARNRPVAGLFLENPVSTARAVVRHRVPAPLRPFVRLRLADDLADEGNLKGITEVTVPSVFVAAGKDQITPAGMARHLHSASTAAYKRLVVVKGAGHNGLYRYQSHKEAFADLIDQLP